MPLAQQWREELHDHRWSVAQINASFADSVETLLAMKGIRDGGSAISEHCFELNNEDAYFLFVAYALAGSDWTFLESVQGCLDATKLLRLSKKLNTDVLVAEFEDNPGCSGWICYRKGKVIAAGETGDPEFFDPRSDCYEGRTPDGQERSWITNSSMTLRFFGDLTHELDIETSTFEDSWDAIANKLGTDVPYLKWSLTNTNPTTCALNDPEVGLGNSALFESK